MLDGAEARLAVDIGGTFTDIVLEVGQDRRTRNLESFSEPIPLPRGKPLVTLRNAALPIPIIQPSRRSL